MQEMRLDWIAFGKENIGGDEMIVEKKCWPELFERVLNGEKKADIRIADFNIKAGDVLMFKEYNPKTKTFTGRKIEKKVSRVNKVDILKMHSAKELRKNGLLLIELD